MKLTNTDREAIASGHTVILTEGRRLDGQQYSDPEQALASLQDAARRSGLGVSKPHLDTVVSPDASYRVCCCSDGRLELRAI